jgi:hypothetical protein
MQTLSRIMAAMLVALAMAVTVGCAVDPIERLSEDIKSQEKTTREQAILLMAKLDDDRTIELLTDMLESDDELFNKAAVVLVKKGRDVDEVDPKKPNPVVDVVGKVLNNAHLAEPFRARAAWVLGEIGDRRAIPALQAGQGAKVGEKPAVMVQDYAKQGLEKLGFFTDGRPFDLAPGTLDGEITTIPEPPALPAAG